jgi:hypothetical protein
MTLLNYRVFFNFKTATMTKALDGLRLKTTQQEETIAQLNAKAIDQLQRETEMEDELNDLFVKEDGTHR